MFFAIDGATGVGKTTVTRLLPGLLAQALPTDIVSKLQFVRDSEGHPLRDSIRRMVRPIGLRENADEDFCPKAQLLHFWAGRVTTCRRLSRMIHSEDIPIITRFGASTWVNQVYVHNRLDDLDQLHWTMVEACVVGERLQPPYYFMLDAAPELLDERIAKGPKVDHFPDEWDRKKRLAFLEKIRLGYREYLCHSSQTGEVVDASGAIKNVAQHIAKRIVEIVQTNEASQVAA